MQLLDIFCEASQRALVLHAKDKGLTQRLLDNLAEVNRTLKDYVASEYMEMLDTLKQATDANMGDAVYKHTINVYANTVAAKTLATLS